MKSAKRTKKILVAFILAVLTTATCFAASQIISITSVPGYAFNKFESYPSDKQMQKAAEFLPKYVEQFENGYAFEEAFVGKLEGKDEGKNQVAMIKSAEFTYMKGDSELYLYVMEKPQNSTEFPPLEGEEIALTDAQTVFYDDYLNKFKPGDYVMTEQDKIDEANGTYVFSFGEDFDFIKHIQMIEWEEDGIRYSLNCLDEKLTKEALLEMAEEIIKK
ncbi:hypothetical protein [Anoxynatronum buryatiense]|nr:hypothetical protein [Anoxynatronum buryatiense]